MRKGGVEVFKKQDISYSTPISLFMKDGEE